MEATRRLGALFLIAKGFIEIVNLRPGGALRWKVETADWEGRGVWYRKADTSKVVAPACVSEGPMGWLSWASIECTDRMLVYRPSKLM
jgi:hypothetical protein